MRKLADRGLGRLLKLPPVTSTYTVRRDVPVPMRDGVDLLADHYVPSGTPRGTLLVRSPYGRAGTWALFYARPYAERGYHVVVQSCRGTFGSGGEVGAFAGEAEDGADTVAWLRDEPWFTGTFVTLGVSYLGFNQWALLTDPPPEMVGAIIVSGPHDGTRILYEHGAFALQSAVGWGWAILNQEKHNPVVGTVVALATQDKQVAPALNDLPLGAAARGVFGGQAPWHDRWLAHPDTTDSFWDSMRLGQALERTTVPVLLYSGWQDMMLEQTLEQYAALTARGIDVSVTVGPWNHAELLTKGSGITARDALSWLDEVLVGDGKRTQSSPVRVSIGGEWRSLSSWPPVTTEEVLHLGAGGTLAAVTGEGTSEFTYDPTDPTPMVGGLTNAPTAGSRDNTKREARSDVLTFTGPVLQHDLEVTGVPVVELAHRSDNPYADVFVRLCEVDAKGRSKNISEAYVRLDRASESLRLELSPTGHRFARGSRLRLQVSGGSHPQHDRNLGTGEPAATGTATRPSHRTIDHAGSRLVLPIRSSAGAGSPGTL